MLISVDKRLVVFSMPKCGSIALVSSLAPHFGAAFKGPEQMKHTPFVKYQKFIRPYLATFTSEPFETVCLFREPLDWLGSWWRYRMRPEAETKGTSTKGLSFDAFLEGNLAGSGPATHTGRQSRFVSDAKGALGVDRIYRYENIAACCDYICDRLEVSVELPRLNASRGWPEQAAHSEDVAARVREAYARDFEIYHKIAV